MSWTAKQTMLCTRPNSVNTHTQHERGTQVQLQLGSMLRCKRANQISKGTTQQILMALRSAADSYVPRRDMTLSRDGSIVSLTQHSCTPKHTHMSSTLSNINSLPSVVVLQAESSACCLHSCVLVLKRLKQVMRLEVNKTRQASKIMLVHSS